jgi:acyl-CoA reductase-like NAD-dependent aldehyde dehydrogenase
VSRLAPVIVSGNTAVVVASETRPLPAITLAEVLATSDLPAGWSTCSPGFAAELVGPLAAHMDVDALDLAGLDLACTGRPSWPRPRTSSGSCPR